MKKKTEMEIENEFKFLNVRIMFTWFLEYFLSMCALVVFFIFSSVIWKADLSKQ